MRVVHGFRDVPAEARRAVLVIGNLDGVHKGHQALIFSAIETARAIGAPAGALVFEPHPRAFFHPEEPHFQLTSLEQKLALFEEFGLDFAAVISFDAALAGLSADDFIKQVLIDGLAVRHVIIGYDFFFGSKRGGNPDTMRAAAKSYGFGLTVVPPVAEDGQAFSSSAIRLHLAQGDVKGAAEMLGRWWRIAGPVVGGAKRGSILGFPTANVPLARDTSLGHGIYAVRSYIGLERYDAAAYLGTRPTYDDGMPVLEVFLFDFEGELYGRQIEVEFIDFIRADRKFDSSEELIAQMHEDCAWVRQILSGAGPKPPNS